MSVTTVSPTQVVRDLGLMVSNEAVALKAGIPDYSKKFSAGASGQEVKIAKPASASSSSLLKVRFEFINVAPCRAGRWA
jgi:hypothetical protein